ETTNKVLTNATRTRYRGVGLKHHGNRNGKEDEAQDLPACGSGSHSADGGDGDDEGRSLQPRHGQGKADPGRGDRGGSRTPGEGCAGPDGAQGRGPRGLREVQRYSGGARG